MKPLFVLLISFLVAVVSIRITTGSYDWQLAGCIALAVMLLFTATGHFAFTKGMALMVPGFIPAKEAVVYLTGIIEIAAAIGLLIPGMRLLTGWLLIAFFIVMLPANIQAAIRHIDYQHATQAGPGLSYLWFRVPLQLLFIAWAWVFAVKPW